MTEVHAAFPALSALAKDFEIFAVTEASSTVSHLTCDAAWERMPQAGAQLMTWFGAACELHRSWRNDADSLRALFAARFPDCKNLIQSHVKNTVK